MASNMLSKSFQSYSNLSFNGHLQVIRHDLKCCTSLNPNLGAKVQEKILAGAYNFVNHHPGSNNRRTPFNQPPDK